MSDHYYTARPDSAHDVREVRVEILNEVFAFSTDAGVFSRDGLDPGSRLLIESACALEGQVLDLGCGWGAVGVCLARANPGAQFWLLDVNERAVALAQGNICANRVPNARALASDGFAALPGELTFRHILTNPPIRAGKRVIYALFDEAARRLAPGGELRVVIRKQQGAPSARARLAEIFGRCEVIARGGGYHVLRAARPARDPRAQEEEIG